MSLLRSCRGSLFVPRRSLHLAGLIRSTAALRPNRRDLPGADRHNASVNRELPDPLKVKRRQTWYFGVFCVTMTLSMFGLIKYEAASSPIVSSTLYTLRRSPLAAEVLGDSIRFASTAPWISGSAGIAQKEVDFRYDITGTKGNATVHFHAEKIPGENRYRVLDWSITPENGVLVDLIDEDFHPYIPGPKEEPGRQLSGRGPK